MLEALPLDLNPNVVSVPLDSTCIWVIMGGHRDSSCALYWRIMWIIGLLIHASNSMRVGIRNRDKWAWCPVFNCSRNHLPHFFFFLSRGGIRESILCPVECLFLEMNKTDCSCLPPPPWIDRTHNPPSASCLIQLPKTKSHTRSFPWCGSHKKDKQAQTWICTRGVSFPSQWPKSQVKSWVIEMCVSSHANTF